MGPAGGAHRGPRSSRHSLASESAARGEGIQWAPSRVRPAGWRCGRAGVCGEPDSRGRAETGGGWCPYIKAGPATREGGGEPGRRTGGESGSATAAPLISTRWFGPPGTGDPDGRGGEGGIRAGRIVRKCCYSCWSSRLLPFFLSGVGAVPEAAPAIGRQAKAPPL